jgi:hypothetical protein
MTVTGAVLEATISDPPAITLPSSCLLGATTRGNGQQHAAKPV